MLDHGKRQEQTEYRGGLLTFISWKASERRYHLDQTYRAGRICKGRKKNEGEHLRTKQLIKLQRQEWINYILGRVTLSIQGQIHDPEPRYNVYSPQALHIKGGRTGSNEYLRLCTSVLS